MSFVELTMKSTQDWHTRGAAQQFIEILTAEVGFLLPQKYDSIEPCRFRFDPSNLEELLNIWESETARLLLERNKPYPAHMTFRTSKYREQRQFNELLAGFDERYFAEEANVAKFLSFAKQVYLWGQMLHGYICHGAEWESKNYLGGPTVVRDKLMAFGGVRLQEGLPGIYWANFFGPIYVQFFGREKFRTVPAYYKEELADGGYLLLTSASPLDFAKPDVRKLGEAMLDHLGGSAFFEKASPQKECITPSFVFEQQALGRPIEVSSSGTTDLVTADPQRFVQEVPTLAQALETVFGRALDYSPKSLERIDKYILEQRRQQIEPWNSSEGREMLQMLAAYYGEVLRRNLSGKWSTMELQESRHPIVTLSTKYGSDYELPITRVIKLWLDGEDANGLVAQYHLLKTGQLAFLREHQRGLTKRKRSWRDYISRLPGHR